MRLITHNFLKCNMRGVITGYPLIIECEAHEVIPSTEFDAGIRLFKINIT